MNKKLDNTATLIHDVSILVEEAKKHIAFTVNKELIILYWQIGIRINSEVLKAERAEYGKYIINLLSSELTAKFGVGWGTKHLRHCLNFAEIFTDVQIVHLLSKNLSWSHIRMIIYMDDPLKRAFYIEMCKLEHWSVRQLQERIQSMLYERTAISRKPEETIKRDLEKLSKENIISPDLVFRDPYILNFLGLSDSYSEKDMESAILAELQRFIIELGSDFAFMARQKRITIDNKDYKIDLLFYHRRLKSLVAIDLKLGEFEASHKGQMELYLRYLEKYEQVEGENSPVGLILCTGKNEEHIELLQLDKNNIRIAEYMTLLPSQKILQEKLHKAIEIAKSRLMSNDEN